MISDDKVKSDKVKSGVCRTGEVRESGPGSQSMSAADKEHCVL